MFAIASPSSVVRAAFLGTSTAVHLAAFAALGHTAGAGRAFDPIELTLETAVSEPADRAEAPEAPRMRDPRAAEPPPSHTHPYPVPANHDAKPHDPSVVHLPIPSTLGVPAVAAAPAAATASTEAPARFLMVVGNLATSPGGIVSAQGTSTTAAGFGASASEAVRESDVSEPARPVGAILPKYPREARAQGVEVDVPVDVVVTDRGTVADVHIPRRVGYGFDESALSAMRMATFRPALRMGRPTAVRMRYVVHFKFDR